VGSCHPSPQAPAPSLVIWRSPPRASRE
jgi:hypothetical protein